MTMVSSPSDFKNGASVAKLTASAVVPTHARRQLPTHCLQPARRRARLNQAAHLNIDIMQCCDLNKPRIQITLYVGVLKTRQHSHIKTKIQLTTDPVGTVATVDATKIDCWHGNSHQLTTKCLSQFIAILRQHRQQRRQGLDDIISQLRI